MSLKFTQLKPIKLGLDSTLDFGRHFGYTVLEVLKDRPEYIRWLIREGKEVYPSVVEYLDKHDPIITKPFQYIYFGDLRGEMANEIMMQAQSLVDQDWFDDVPF